MKVVFIHLDNMLAFAYLGEEIPEFTVPRIFWPPGYEATLYEGYEDGIRHKCEAVIFSEDCEFTILGELEVKTTSGFGDYGNSHKFLIQIRTHEQQLFEALESQGQVLDMLGLPIY